MLSSGRKQTEALLVCVVIIFSCIPLASKQVVQAVGDPVVLIVPEEIEVNYCSIGDVAVCVANFTDLHAFEFKIWWLKAAVEYYGYEWKTSPWTMDLQVGPVFEENATHASVQFGITAFAAPPASYEGTWPFIDIFFHCIDPYLDSPLVFDGGSTFLYDEFASIIPIGTILNGLIRNKPQFSYETIPVSWSWVDANALEVWYTANVTVNSTGVIQDFQFNRPLQQLQFSLPASLIGSCNVTIPKPLMSGAFTLFINGSPTPSIVTWNRTHTSVYFTYQSSCNVAIKSEICTKLRGLWQLSDVNGDGVVDIFDIVSVALDFSWKEAP